MAESVYKVIELVGSSSESWQQAAAAALSEASKTVRDLRVAEISAFDIALEDGVIKSYRVKIKASFKIESER